MPSFKSIVFKRPARTVKEKQKDGSYKTYAVKSTNWTYRVKYEENGKPKSVERGGFRTKNEAKDARDAMIRSLERSDGQITTGEKMTFESLCEIAKKEFYRPATFREGRKTSGVKSYATVEGMVDHLKAFFKKRLISSITKADLVDYKEFRTTQGIKGAKSKEAKKRTIKLSTVNRELATMRKIMRYALAQGWVLRDIFFKAGVIDAGNESARDVTLSIEDEVRLLAACGGEREVTYKRKKRGSEEKSEVTAKISTENPLLRAMIVLALDSGMRRGEILKMRWSDVDFETGVITVIGTHTKTERERLAPLSDRAKRELEKIRPISDPVYPFPIDSVKRSFATALRLSGLVGLRFHDLRRTFVTRQLAAGVSPMIVAKIAGHSQLQTTMKHYTAIGVNEVQEVAKRINAMNEGI